MITLFISTVEMWYGLILFTLLGLYALSKGMLSHGDTISEKARKMTDKELWDYFCFLVEEQVEKPSFWRGQELDELWKASQKRELLKEMPDEDLVIYCKSISALSEAFGHSKLWYKRLTLVQREMKRRYLL